MNVNILYNNVIDNQPITSNIINDIIKGSYIEHTTKPLVFDKTELKLETTKKQDSFYLYISENVIVFDCIDIHIKYKLVIDSLFAFLFQYANTIRQFKKNNSKIKLIIVNSNKIKHKHLQHFMSYIHDTIINNNLRENKIRIIPNPILIDYVFLCNDVFHLLPYRNMIASINYIPISTFEQTNHDEQNCQLSLFNYRKNFITNTIDKIIDICFTVKHEKQHNVLQEQIYNIIMTNFSLVQFINELTQKMICHIITTNKPTNGLNNGYMDKQKLSVLLNTIFKMKRDIIMKTHFDEVSDVNIISSYIYGIYKLIKQTEET